MILSENLVKIISRCIFVYEDNSLHPQNLSLPAYIGDTDLSIFMTNEATATSIVGSMFVCTVSLLTRAAKASQGVPELGYKGVYITTCITTCI